MLWSRPANISAEIDLEWLLKAMPASEAKLYRALIQLIPAPSVEAPNQARRQIKMEVLAKLTGFTKRWVIELLPRLEEKNLIRTEGGSGVVKWIWRLPLGVPRLGKPYPNELTQKKTTSPGQAKAPRVAASQKTPTQRNGVKPEGGCRRQGRSGRRENGGNSSSAPGNADAIDPTSRSGSRQPGGAGHHGDTAICTSRSDVARPYVDATVAFDGPRRPGNRQPGGAGRRGDIATSGTSKTSIPAQIHQKTPCRTAALGKRPNRRTSGIRMLPSRHPADRFEGARHDRTPVAPCSRAPLPADGTLRVDALPG